MQDILDEIEQDLRRDQAARVWKRWRVPIILVALLFVGAVAGWRGYVAWQGSRAAATGDRYLEAVREAEAGRRDEAIAGFEALARDAPGGYPALARLRIAAERAAKGETAAAVADYDAIANDLGAPPAMRDVARLRAALLLVDTAPITEVAAQIERVAVAGNPYRHTARELLGLAAYRADDKAAAARWFRDLVTDPEAPNSVRNRGSLALTMLAADGVTPAGR